MTLLVGEPGLNNATRPPLFSFDNTLVIGFILDEKALIRLQGIVQLKGEKIFRISELFDQQRQDWRSQSDQGIKFPPYRPGVWVRTDGKAAAEPAFFPGAEGRIESGSHSSRDLCQLLVEKLFLGCGEIRLGVFFFQDIHRDGCERSR